MFVENMLEAARERLVAIADDATLIETAKQLTSGTDLVIVSDNKGVLQGVVTKTDVVRQISVCQGATCLCPVSTVMTRDVALCRVTDHLSDVAVLMKERHLKNIPWWTTPIGRSACLRRGPSCASSWVTRNIKKRS